jgi:hypothetical protein
MFMSSNKRIMSPCTYCFFFSFLLVSHQRINIFASMLYVLLKTSKLFPTRKKCIWCSMFCLALNTRIYVEVSTKEEMLSGYIYVYKLDRGLKCKLNTNTIKANTLIFFIQCYMFRFNEPSSVITLQKLKKLKYTCSVVTVVLHSTTITTIRR